MNVLSLFNGMSFGMMALETLNVPVTNYYSSEIDKYTNQATAALFPDVIQLGDVTKWNDWELPEIDLIIGGPPCQAFSVAGKRLAFDDPRGMLTHKYFEILDRFKPKDVFFENVTGVFSADNGAAFPLILSEFNRCGYAVDFKVINSSLVSAQNRQRIYILGKRLDLCQGKSYDITLTKGFINEHKR